MHCKFQLQEPAENYQYYEQFLAIFQAMWFNIVVYLYIMYIWLK